MIIKELYKDEPLKREQLEKWQRSALEQFEKKIKDPARPFPCIPATIGFSLNHIRYGFAGDPRTSAAKEEASTLLTAYTNASRQFGQYTSLILFYETPKDLKDTHTVEDFEQLFWEQLNGLHDHDGEDWPEHIPVDPHNPIWEFCYDGEQYFMYCATPAHQNRKSRHFDYFMLAITPRWVLQEFNKSEAYAKKIKEKVRKRLEAYDSAPIHPDLNTYGSKDNYEWRQYFLRDDDTSLSKCPFHQLIKGKADLRE